MIDCLRGWTRSRQPTPHGAWVEFASVKTSRATTDQQQSSLSIPAPHTSPNACMRACVHLQYALHPGTTYCSRIAERLPESSAAAGAFMPRTQSREVEGRFRLQCKGWWRTDHSPASLAPSRRPTCRLQTGRWRKTDLNRGITYRLIRKRTLAHSHSSGI
jgi:hypothetical protein